MGGVDICLCCRITEPPSVLTQTINISAGIISVWTYYHAYINAAVNLHFLHRSLASHPVGVVVVVMLFCCGDAQFVYWWKILLACYDLSEGSTSLDCWTQVLNTETAPISVFRILTYDDDWTHALSHNVLLLIQPAARGRASLTDP